MEKILISLIFALLIVLVSCGEDSKKVVQIPEGSEGGPCYGNKTCDDGLTCVSDLCVDLSELSDNDSGNTGNTGDSGNTGNTGNSGDSGNSGDTGDTGNSGNTSDTGNTGVPETCGNGTKEIDEVCDGNEISCNEISSKYLKGTATCSELCQWNTEPCIEAGDMIKIPSGDFTMGCQNNNCSDFLAPSHEVTLSSFMFSIFEVSVKEYEECLKSGACNNNDVDKKHFKTVSDDAICNINSSRKDHPANCVSWFGAKAFCEWKNMRLPTEAEWEYVASGQGEGWKYPWGDNDPNCDFAVLDDSSDDEKDFGCGKDSTWAIGSKSDNNGIYDLGGNVFEWCYDGSGEYTDKHVTDPLFTPDEYWQRIFRGSSFRSTIGLYDDQMECVQRYSDVPEYISPEIGFRCAKYYNP